MTPQRMQDSLQKFRGLFQSPKIPATIIASRIPPPAPPSAKWSYINVIKTLIMVSVPFITKNSVQDLLSVEGNLCIRCHNPHEKQIILSFCEEYKRAF